MKIRVLAPAKINLYLEVKRKRPDGYHDIETLFERLRFFDRIILTKKKKAITVTCDDRKIPTHRSSLCYRAAALLKKRYNVDSGADIRIIKKIPIAAGLGGGSSDAAGILLGLNRLWRLRLKRRELMEIGGSLGSDIPFFLSGRTFAVGKKRGDELKGVVSKRRFWHILACPSSRTLSGDIYGVFDRNPRSGRKKKKRTSLAAFKKGDIRKMSGLFANDLEEAVSKREPAVLFMKGMLKNTGCKFSLVSGSGPSVFGLFKTRKEAVAARKRLQSLSPAGSRRWRTFVVTTY